LSRPGYVLEVDRSTPPILFHHGEGFSLERLPVGSRVIYPPEPVKALPDPDAAVRRALLEPLGMDPLPTYLRPGMRLTIAFDDISLPLPPMKGPDNRQRVIEGRPRPGRRGGGGRRRVDLGHRAAPPHDRPRTQARRGQAGLRRLRPHGLLYNHERRGPRRHGNSSVTPTRANGSRSTSGRRRRISSSTSHQPGADGRRPQERGHRPGRLPPA